MDEERHGDVEAPGEGTLVENRLHNLEQIRGLVGNVYPDRFDRTAGVSELVEKFSSRSGEELEAAPESVRVAGRILAIRVQGKAGFLDLSDGRSRLQVYVRKDTVGEPAWDLFRSLDLGDWIGVAGQMFRTRTGQLSVKSSELAFLAKCLKPLPEKWHGLKDVERRYRQRYLDLAVNPESRDVFEKRAAIVREIRRFLDERGFLEVETPMMQPIAGGALARPFVTHHNALDIELFLRIAPELYLKRLVVGGLERVYEINRNFRNEGISTQHNPEFTMLEFYQAYARASDLMDLSEQMLARLAQAVSGGSETPWGEHRIDWSPPYRRVTMRQAVLDATSEDARGPVRPEELESAERLLAAARRFGVEKPERFEGQKGKLLAELFEAVGEAGFIQPTFLHEFPTEISPLSKQDPANPEWVDRFELYAGGMEIANGFSELNDPSEQQRRFVEQARQKAGGDHEAMQVDDDYVEALSYGMPPTAGEGVGIDRVTMLLTGKNSIRDVILFPLMRPR
ncbi:MAG TPA: lysine--tRNA ligase, partial [Thermoanaerobaculia bacterium]|nr:lysine--tRNA ligase [Thermoanaerobaculia bacterium]